MKSLYNTDLQANPVSEKEYYSRIIKTISDDESSDIESLDDNQARFSDTEEVKKQANQYDPLISYKNKTIDGEKTHSSH